MTEIVAFRVDSSPTIGSGHLRRCLALAEFVRSTGRRCCFISRAHPGNLNAQVVEAGHELIELPAAAGDDVDGEGYAAWLGVPEEADAALSKSAIAGRDIAAMIVDHYALGRAWEERLRPHCAMLLAIDDLANRTHSVDILVDVTPISDPSRYDALVTPQTRLLLGPRFAILRPEFRQARATLATRSGEIGRIFITFGAIDSQNWTEAAVAAVRGAMGRGIMIDVAISSSAPHAGRLREIASTDELLSLHFDTSDVAKLMAAADLGIGAGGTTSWERACLGLASILTPIADNQRDPTAAICAAGCALALAGDRVTYTARLAATLELLRGNPNLLQRIGWAAGAIVDGVGASRIVDELFPAPLTPRRATADDARDIWCWRNEPRVRESSRDPGEIGWADHLRWFEKVLANENIALLICESASQPVAVLRFDLSRNCAEISIYLTSQGSGRGLGADVLRAGEKWLRAAHPEIARIVAIILPSNRRSIAAFADAGYESSVFTFERELL